MGCVGVIKPTYFIIIISIHSSIHAPTWGATTGAHDAYPLGAFQSTHPHGVRRKRGDAMPEKTKHFNPRTHMGCDGNQRSRLRGRLHFNPRTHMGCDVITWLHSAQLRYFNPRTHMGCDVITWLHSAQLRYFNPRTHMGCDRIDQFDG